MGPTEFFGLVKDSLARFKAASWIFGVAAVIAAISLAASTKYPWQVFAFGAIGVFLCGGMLAIAGAAYEQKIRESKPPGATLAFIWICLGIFAVWSLLFTSCVFFNFPKSPLQLFGVEAVPTPAELREKARSGLKEIRTHKFFTDDSFEAAIGFVQGTIVSLCSHLEEKAKAGATNKELFQKAERLIEIDKEIIASKKTRLAELRRLDELLAPEIELLRKLKNHPQLKPDQIDHCLQSSIEQLEAFRKLMGLVADWIEQPQELHYEETPSYIGKLISEARPGGPKKRLIELPRDIDDCLAKLP
jgi:hypothetical protein